MSRASTLFLLAPDVRFDVVSLADSGDSRWPHLARLAGRGRIARLPGFDTRHAALRPWQQVLMRALSLDDSASRHASAPLTHLGKSQLAASGYWMHAEPVHLAAGLDRLTFVPLIGEAQPTKEERAQLRGTVEEHLTAEGFTLHDAGDASWLVQPATPLHVQTVCPEAARVDLDRALPQGEDAGRLRRIMTEVQMLWHEHPVNLARERRGLPAINSMWFWGGGALEAAPSTHLVPGFGDDAYLCGLYRLYGATARETPARLDELLTALDARSSAVCVEHAVSLDELEHRWIEALMRALLAGRIARIELLLGDWLLSADRLAVLRFWRRPSPPAKWVA